MLMSPCRPLHHCHSNLHIDHELPFTLLRTATTLHRPVIFWHVPTKPLLLLLIPSPTLLKRIERHLHYPMEDIALTLLFNACDKFVEDPAFGDELQHLLVPAQIARNTCGVHTLGLTRFIASCRSVSWPSPQSSRTRSRHASSHLAILSFAWSALLGGASLWKKPPAICFLYSSLANSSILT